MTDFEAASSRIRSASFSIVTSCVLPMLMTWPIAFGSCTSFTSAPTTSLTCVKARDCVPSPKTVIGSPASACRTKLGMTIPYWPVWRGPTVLKKRTTITGSLRSFQYASARNSSIALLHAYAQRCLGVGPSTRSESSRNGTSSLLPYTSEVDAITTSFFFLFACFSTTSVPCTLVSIVWTGCSTISLTPTAAARWKTTSLRSISSASSGSLLTVSMKYSKPDRPFKRAMLSIDPVDRSSRISTSWPWSSNASDRWDPMKPAPPVINARTRDVLSRNRGRRRERVHRLRDRVDVGVVERRIQRQREYLVARARRNRALARIGRRQRRLARNRHGIVNERLDAARREVRLQIRARVRS